MNIGIVDVDGHISVAQFAGRQCGDCVAHVRQLRPRVPVQEILQRGHGYAKGGFFDIAPALTTSKWQDNNFAVIEYWIRKLTPRECFRLMDVPEHHIDRLLSAGISNSQLYKLAGNSIVVACLYHIFRKMFCETAREYGAPTAHSQEIPDVQQLSLF